MLQPPSTSNDEPNRRQERRSAESVLFSLEADRAHLVRQQTLLATMLHGLRVSVKHGEEQVRDQELKLGQVESKISAIDAEIHEAKKHLRMIH